MLRVEFFIPRTWIGWAVALVIGAIVGIVVWNLGLGTPNQNLLLGAGAAIAGGTRAAVSVEHRLAAVFYPEPTSLGPPGRDSNVGPAWRYNPNRPIVEAFIRRLNAYSPSEWASFFERLARPDRPRNEVHRRMAMREAAAIDMTALGGWRQKEDADVTTRDTLGTGCRIGQRELHHSGPLDRHL